LLISVTSLFRDPEVHEYLKRVALPRLLEDRHPEDTLRVWVPGCSRGDEVYSIAMCLQEVVSEQAPSQRVEVFATDVNERAIEQARAGLFPASAAEQVSPERLQRFFSEVHGGYQVKRQLRELCVFARHDLTRDPPFSRLDLISCRNVLIYLSPTLQERVLKVFHYALKPTGYLLLGRSEALGRAANLFTEVEKGMRYYARRSSSTPLDADYRGSLSQAFETDSYRIDQLPSLPGSPFNHLEVQREADRVLLTRLAPVGVVVDETMQVLQFRGRTGLFLEPSPGGATQNLLSLVREGLLADLRSAIQEARAKDQPVRLEGLRVRSNHHYTRVNLEVIPLRVPRHRGRPLLVLFEQPQEVPPTKPLDSSDQAEVFRLQQELAATRDYLSSLTEQHDLANEDLKAANEEIQSANEELQSANEELQTAKEELQSTNEELTTLNEELCDRNLELARLNNDLNNLLGSINVPVIILGPDLKIRRFTPLAEKILHLRQGDVQRGIGDLTTFSIPNLEERIRDVIDHLYPQELEIQDRSGHWYSVRIRPYRTAENVIDGAVVAFVDIEPLKRLLEESRQTERRSRGLLEEVPQPLLVLDPQLQIIQVNRSFCGEFGVKAEDLEGQPILDVNPGGWVFGGLRGALESMRKGESREPALLSLSSGGRHWIVQLRPILASSPESPEALLLAFESRGRVT
jgi:two-component system CheB/CheR fusion protein